MKRLLALVSVAWLTMLFTAGCVDSAKYNEELVGKFSPTQHVLVEDGAVPQLPHPDKINAQVLAAGQKLNSQFDPTAKMTGIFIADVGKDKAGDVTYDSLHDAFVSKYGGFSGIILVLSDSYYVKAFNVSEALASNVDRVLKESSAAHHGDVYGGTTAFVTGISGVSEGDVPAAPAPVPGSAAAPQPTVVISPAVKPQPSHPFPWATVGIAAAILGLLGLGGAGIGFGVQARNRRREERNRLEKRIIKSRANVESVSNTLYSSDAALQTKLAEASNQAGSALASADAAFKAGNYNAVDAHLDTVESAIKRADYVLDPDHEAIKAVPEEARKKVTIVTKDDKGFSQTLSNTDHTTRRRDDYCYYWRGGIYNDVYFGPGYYQYPFLLWSWTPSDVTVFPYNVDYTPPPSGPMWSTVGSSSSYTPPSGGGGVSRSSGGSRRSYSSSSSSRSSSYDSGGSSSSYGGGFDSGGSSSSFGGGGFDSGGSSAGF